jgi:hypothetical protein|tara:strand:- start:1299 stop:1496 length:198 start_codon:yes stop_codon:yes gene_type:complete
MKKFNGFENHLIQEAIKLYIENAEKEITNQSANEGKRFMFAPGYFTMIGKDLSYKIDNMTLKKHR